MIVIDPLPQEYSNIPNNKGTNTKNTPVATPADFENTYFFNRLTIDIAFNPMKHNIIIIPKSVAYCK